MAKFLSSIDSILESESTSEEQFVYPATPAQVRLWGMMNTYESKRYFNLSKQYLIEGDIDIPSLNLALKALVAKHSILRAYFVTKMDKVYLCVKSVVEVAINHKSIKILNDDAADVFIKEQASYQFDLSNGPLISLNLYSCQGTNRHILSLNSHLLINDTISLAAFVEQLSRCYELAKSGKAIFSEDTAITFINYATSYQPYVNCEDVKKSNKWWRKHLASPLPVTELPTDFPRRKNKGFSSHTQTRKHLINNIVTSELHTFLEKQQLSLLSFLQLIIRVLVHRCTGQHDIILGNKISGRTRPELKGALGYFEHILPIRYKLDESRTFLSELKETEKLINEALNYHTYDVVCSLEGSSLLSDLSCSSLYDVMLVLHEHQMEELKLGNTTVTSIASSNLNNLDDCDLVFEVYQDGQGLLLEVKYNYNIFSSSRIERYIKYFSNLIESSIKLQEHQLNELDMLSSEEKQFLLRSGDGGFRQIVDKGIPDLLRDVANRYANSIALTDGRDEVSYQLLISESEQIARGLLANGIGSGDVAALVYDRGISSIKLLIAIMMTGATYMPLNVNLPHSRIEKQLNGSRCKAILLTDINWDKSIDYNCPKYLIQELKLNGITKANPLPKVDTNDVAYTIYTSGSTGDPKGVLISHKGFINMSIQQIEMFKVTPQSHVLQFAPLAFDASLANIFMALFSGAKLVLIDQVTIEQPHRFLDFLLAQEVTVATVPPTYLSALSQPLLPSLKTLITAGEEANTVDLLHYSKTMSCFNAYGPTETSVCATIERVNKASVNSHNQVVMGKPIANTQLYVLSRNNCLAPIGVPGELCIAGEGVALGYQGEINQTDKAFVEMPSILGSDGGRQRLYRTGDMVYWDDQGRLNFIGRRDNQFKINGFRVDALEIKKVLESLPQVESAYVEKSKGIGKLAAWVILKREPELWPSVAEFYVYDELLYAAMANDDARNSVYRMAFDKYLKGKTVVEIGPGSDIVLSRLAIEAGAKKVYAVELLKQTYEKAKRRVHELGLEDRIEIIHSDIRNVHLPEKVDWCISEIVGSIGGSEGSALLINSARKLLKDPANMLPMRSVTSLAAVSLDHEQFYHGFSQISAHYIEEIFAAHGAPFDLRLCVKNLPKNSVISNTGLLEELDYTRKVDIEAQHNTELTILKNSMLSGLICWLQLYVDEEDYVDSLFAEKSWLPVYIPLFDGESRQVEAGDKLSLLIERKVNRNRLNPDFFITGELQQKSETHRIYCKSLHEHNQFRGDTFNKRIYGNGVVKVPRAENTVSEEVLREHLVKELPSYSVPHSIRVVERLPLNENGKVDTELLSSNEHNIRVKRTAENEMESTIEKVWRRVFDMNSVSIDDNFFCLGGDSINAIALVSELVNEGLNVSVRDIFHTQTIEKLASVCSRRELEQTLDL